MTQSRPLRFPSLARTLAAAAAITLSAGCAARVQHVTNIPTNTAGQPVATEDQVKHRDEAVANLHKIADINSSLRQLVISLNKQGVFPDGPAYVTALNKIGRIDQVEISSADFLNNVPKTWSANTASTIQANMWIIQQQIQQLNVEGVTGIKNADSLKLVNQSISELTSVVNVILSLAGGNS